MRDSTLGHGRSSRIHPVSAGAATGTAARAPRSARRRAMMGGALRRLWLPCAAGEASSSTLRQAPRGARSGSTLPRMTADGSMPTSRAAGPAAWSRATTAIALARAPGSTRATWAASRRCAGDPAPSSFSMRDFTRPKSAGALSVHRGAWRLSSARPAETGSTGMRRRQARNGAVRSGSVGLSVWPPRSPSATCFLPWLVLSRPLVEVAVCSAT